jgi:hypothetical protein
LIASIPVGPYQSVRFVENGKLVATVQVPARPSNSPSAAGNDPFKLHLRAGVKPRFEEKGSAVAVAGEVQTEVAYAPIVNTTQNRKVKLVAVRWGVPGGVPGHHT